MASGIDAHRLPRTRLMKSLRPSVAAAFARDGFVVLPGFKSPVEIAAVSQRARAIVEAFEPPSTTAIFTTNDQTRTADDYFLDSADKIRCFFEEEAFEGNPKLGRLKQAKALSINKIGHALHDLDPVFAAFSRGPQLATLATDLGLAAPLIWQSMVIFKQPGIGGEVRWHQDATFFDTTPITVTTFWFALEDATRNNGCLWVQPGGHLEPLRERFVRSAGDIVCMEKLNETPWPDETAAVAVEVSAGSLVVMHGLLPHYSAPNRSPLSRLAYTLHVTDASSVYSPRNWLQRGALLPVTGFTPV